MFLTHFNFKIKLKSKQPKICVKDSTASTSINSRECNIEGRNSGGPINFKDINT